MPTRARAIVLWCALAVAVAGFVAFAASEREGVGPLHNPTDFVAFYCAGKVALGRHDPYRNEPLRSCERAAFAESGVPMFPGLVVPAPLPGYALALFAVFASLPFRVAALLWACTIAGCCAGAAALAQRTTGLRGALVFACFFGADFFASIVVGQIVPLVVLALCATGAALAARRERLAALCAAAMLLEPHVGLPVCAALAIWCPRSRLVLALACGVLAVACVGFVGLAGTVEYATQVLPAQARGEGLEFNGQYGLSAALRALGASAAAALVAGSLSYAAMVAVGVGLARRIACALGEPALVAFVPAAFALFGGAYVHIYQMALALPLALVFVARLERSRALASVALVCLAIPWQTFFSQPAIVALFPAPAPIDAKELIAHVAGASHLAVDVWTQWMATASNRDHRTPLEILIFKLPTWFALATLVVLGVRAALESSGQPGRKRLAPR